MAEALFSPVPVSYTHLRTNHVYHKMRELVQSGQYGQIRRTNWIITDWYRPQAYYDSGAWRATWSGEGGGVLLNQCPHQLDLWQWICGMPVSVLSQMRFGQWHDIEVEDDVTTYVEYANGATGVFVTTTGDEMCIRDRSWPRPARSAPGLASPRHPRRWIPG